MRSARLLGIVLVAAGESAPRIGGPYEDIGVAMRPGPDSLPWEGPQGTDSFFPWRVGGRWRAFYGSARTETKPIGHWLVGPAEAPSLAGPSASYPREGTASRRRILGTRQTESLG